MKKLYCVETDNIPKLTIPVVIMTEDEKNRFKKLLKAKYRTPFIKDGNTILFDVKINDYVVKEKQKKQEKQEKSTIFTEPESKEKRNVKKTLKDELEGETDGKENETRHKEEST